MKSKERENNREFKLIRLPKTSSCILVMSGEKLLGLDLFDSARTFKQFEEKLLQSYRFEVFQSLDKKAKTDTDCAETVLKEVLGGSEDLLEHPLNPEVMNSNGNRFGKNVLFHEDKLCHVTAFEFE